MERQDLCFWNGTKDSHASTVCTLAARFDQQDACISTLKTQVAEMKAFMESTLDALTLRQNSMSHRMCGHEKLLREMRSAYTDRFDRVELSTDEVICYADGMRNMLNEISQRVEDIELAFYDLGEDMPSDETGTRQEPLEPQACHDSIISIVTPVESVSPEENKRESSLSSSPSEATLTLEAELVPAEVLEFDSRQHSENETDSIIACKVTEVHQVATLNTSTDSESSDLNSSGPRLCLEKEEATASHPTEKDQNVTQIPPQSSIRRSLSSWLDSGRRVLRR